MSESDIKKFFFLTYKFIQNDRKKSLTEQNAHSLGMLLADRAYYSLSP